MAVRRGAAVMLLGALAAAAKAADSVAQRAAGSHYGLRYYGPSAFWDGFGEVRTFPADVCWSLPAVCVDLVPGECVKSPSELQAPYDLEEPVANGGGRQVRLGDGEAGAGYLLLALEPNSTRGTLWSGCEEGCGNCPGTGRQLRVDVGKPVCEATAKASVFALIHLGDFVDPHFQCIGSLKAFYQRIEEGQARYTNITVITASCMVSVGCMCLAAACACHRGQLLRHQGRRDLHEPGPTLLAARVFGKEEIERRFPATTTGPVLPRNLDSEIVASALRSTPMCVVCLLPIQAGDKKRTLRCRHTFHADCLLQWWTHRPRSTLECPTCRRQQQTELQEAEQAPQLCAGMSPERLREEALRQSRQPEAAEPAAEQVPSSS